MNPGVGGMGCFQERNGDLEGQLEQMAVEMESRVQRRVESLRQQVEAEVRTAFEESSSTAALEQQLRKLQHMRAGIARSISGLVTVSSVRDLVWVHVACSGWVFVRGAWKRATHVDVSTIGVSCHIFVPPPLPIPACARL